MGLRLEKLALPSNDEISALPSAELLSLALNWRERLELYQERLFRAQKERFGTSSERTPPSSPKEDNPPKPRGETTKLPSERYPNAPVEERKIDFTDLQKCPCCGEIMQDSGMSETSEYVDVKAKQFIVIEQQRAKHRCSKCHSSIVTAPAPSRITPGGSYSDEMIIDATLSKYCDLIPMERYCQMAARGGMPGIPPHSLIQATFELADFLRPALDDIRKEVLDTPVLLADETTHRMLEGDERKKWYLWGFSNKKACFFECHNTRSGDVSSAVLAESSCDVLLTDVYSGYAKSLRIVNEMRKSAGRVEIQAAYCNAHARRQFDPGTSAPDDVKFMVESYQQIYQLEASDMAVLERRKLMRPLFEAMKTKAEVQITAYSSKSQIARAYGYFLGNYDGLTLFLTNANIPIDNNSSERLLRSHVIGRKTWYGTHSKDGAEVAAVHFTIVESCKMNKVNPRSYYQDAVARIHANKRPLTPYEYKRQQTADSC